MNSIDKRLFLFGPGINLPHSLSQVVHQRDTPAFISANTRCEIFSIVLIWYFTFRRYW